MKSLVARFVNDESGATAIEYGLIAGFISLVIVGVGTTMNTSLKGIFEAVSTGLSGAAAKVPATGGSGGSGS